MREDEPDRFVFPFPVLNAHGNPVLLGLRWKFPAVTEVKRISPNGRYPFAHFFNGALVSAGAIRNIGNVERGYFMYGEKVDYSMRLSRVGKVVSVVDAIHHHRDVSRRLLTPIRIYY